MSTIAVARVLDDAKRLGVNAEAFVEDDEGASLQSYFETDLEAFKALTSEVNRARKACTHDRIHHQTPSHSECAHCRVRMVRDRGDWAPVSRDRSA